MSQGPNTRTWCAAAAAIGLMIAGPAEAVDKTFKITFSSDWDNGNNWTPFGVPTTDDSVFIDLDTFASLSSDTAPINILTISNSGEVRTNGFQLWLDAGLGTGHTVITGAGSHIRLTPRTAGGPAFVTDILDTTNGGTLAGNGLVTIVGEVEGVTTLSNNGTIRAEGGTLTIEAVGNGTFDLDGGEGVESGVLEVVDANAILVIDGPLDDDFSGTMNIGGGSFIRFEQGWATDSSGVINFDASGLVGAIDGAQLTFGGTLNVNSGNGRFINTLVDFEATSIVNVAAGATLELFSTNPSDVLGTMNLNGGANPIDAARAGGILMTLAGTVNVDQYAQLNGFTFDALVNVNLNDTDDVLRLGNNTTIQAGATFAGSGRVVNLSGPGPLGTLTTEDSAIIGVTLENQGTLVIGASPGELGVNEFVQTVTGDLEIELGGVIPAQFDVLIVEGNADLAGTLNVQLINNFQPMIGDSFTILETVSGNVDGQFDTENLPVMSGVTFDVVYNPKSVVLQAIAALLLGDANNDGQVTGADLISVQQNFGNVGPTPLLGDANNDGQVTGADLISVQQNFGNVLAPASSPVPEPTGAVILLLGAWLTPRRRRLKRRATLI